MKLSPEQQFVTEILRSFVTGHTDVRPDKVPNLDGLDWSAIMAIVHFHNLLSLFYHEINYLGWKEILPSWFLQQLRQEFLQNTALTMQYESLLGQMQEVLDGQSIPFIVLKGPSIAAEFYHPRAVRSYVDLDILIRRDDYSRVKEVLEDLNFYQPQAELEDIQRQFFNCINYRLHGEPQIALDLQWDTLLVSWSDQSFLRGEHIWQNRRWLDFDGRLLPVLQPVSLVVYLCIHLAVHHQFGRLLSLCDLDLSIRRHVGEIDWDGLVAMVRRMRICKPVSYSLKLAADLLATPLPEGVLTELKMPVLERYFLPLQTLAFKDKSLPKPFALLVKYMLIDCFSERCRATKVYFQKSKERIMVEKSGGS